MRELSETLPWFEAMMVIALRGSLYMNKAVSTKMVCVSEKEAAQIGRNLIPALKSRKVVGAGVLYFIYKVVRGDLRHWVPITGLTGSAVSVALRLVIKLVVDFTGCIQFRHPYDVGGLYFIMNLFLPLIVLTSILSSGLLVGLFFALINGKYRHTFFSVEIGFQMSRRNFFGGQRRYESSSF